MHSLSSHGGAFLRRGGEYLFSNQERLLDMSVSPAERPTVLPNEEIYQQQQQESYANVTGSIVAATMVGVILCIAISCTLCGGCHSSNQGDRDGHHHENDNNEDGLRWYFGGGGWDFEEAVVEEAIAEADAVTDSTQSLTCDAS